MKLKNVDLSEIYYTKYYDINLKHGLLIRSGSGYYVRHCCKSLTIMRTNFILFLYGLPTKPKS